MDIHAITYEEDKLDDEVADVDINSLYMNHFFLHAFLDEYIGSNKGNDANLTINDFSSNNDFSCQH